MIELTLTCRFFCTETFFFLFALNFETFDTEMLSPRRSWAMVVAGGRGGGGRGGGRANEEEEEEEGGGWTVVC